MDLLTSPNQSHPIADLEILASSIQSVTEMLDRVLSYVRAVLAGEAKGNPAVGRYLMDTLGASTGELETAGFNANLQVKTCPFMFLITSRC